MQLLLGGNWKALPNFAKTVVAIDALPKPPSDMSQEKAYKPDAKTGVQQYFKAEEVLKTLDQFLDIFYATQAKHFDRWRYGIRGVPLTDHVLHLDPTVTITYYVDLIRQSWRYNELDEPWPLGKIGCFCFKIF